MMVSRSTYHDVILPATVVGGGGTASVVVVLKSEDPITVLLTESAHVIGRNKNGKQQ